MRQPDDHTETQLIQTSSGIDLIVEHLRLKEQECKQLQQDKAELVEALMKALSIQNLWLPVVAFSDCPPDNIAEIESLHLMANDFAKLIGKHKCN